MKINIHKFSTHFHSWYHLSLLFWFVTVPCSCWPCKESLHHPSQTASASCFSPFPPITQHHGTCFPTAIKTAWLLNEYSTSDFFDYSHTHPPPHPHKLLFHTNICYCPHPSLSLAFLKNSKLSHLPSPQWQLTTRYFSSMAPIMSHQILKIMLSLSPFASISSPAFLPANV